MAYQFPAPRGDGDEILAPNGVLYVYNAADGQWEVKAFVDKILPDPTDDTQQPNTTDDRYVNISGDTMEGELNVVHPPTEDTHAASKLYVDEKTKGLCWEPLINGNGVVNDYDWIRGTDGNPSKRQLKGNKGGQSSATDITSLEFHPDVDLSEVEVGHNIRLKIDDVVDEFTITEVNGNVLTVNLFDQQTTGTPYFYLAPLKISYQVTCSLFVERSGDKMTGHLELEDGFGDIQVFDDTTPDGTAVHKKYVDDLLGDKVSKIGDTMSGTLEFNITGADATAISIKCTEDDQNRIISVDGGTGTSDNLSLLLEGTDGSNNFVISTTAGDCYSISSDGQQVFSTPVTFNNDVVYDFGNKVEDTEPFVIKGTQANNGTGDNILKLVSKDDGDQLRYYGPVSFNKEVATKEYVDSLISTIDLSQLSGVPTGAISFWASSADISDEWFKLDGSTFDIDVYPELHDYLLQSDSYVEGVLPDYSSRFACQIGTINNGFPGEKIEDKSKKPTNLKVQTATVTFTHGHTATITGTGAHSHTATVTGGSHSHSYQRWTKSGTASGGGTGTTNPNSSSEVTVTGGAHTHTLTVTGNGTHTHTISVSEAAASSNTHSHTISGGDTTTRPLSVVGYWIIKN